MKKLTALLLIFTLLFTLPAVAAAEGSEPEQALASVLAGILGYYSSTGTQELLSGPFAEAPAAGAQWYVLALKRLEPGLNGSAYRNALEAYVAEKTGLPATTRELLALTLLAVGSDSEFITATAEEAIGTQGLMSCIFGLHLLTNGVACESHNKEDLVKQIMELQLADGGWAIMGANADPDVTAMVIQGLAPYYENDPQVHDGVEKALALLSAQQLDSGNYMSLGVENPESTVQVIIALASLGIDPLTDERFIRNGTNLLQAVEIFRRADGTYAHEIGGESNENASMEVLLAAAALMLLQKGEAPLYMVDVEAARKQAEAEASEAADEPASGESGDTTGAASGESASGENESDPGNATGTASGENGDETGNAAGTDAGHKRDEDSSSGMRIRTILTIAACAIGLIACLILFLKGKRNRLSFLLVLILTGVAVWALQNITLRSAKEYYGTSETVTGPTIQTTITIRCDTVAGKKEHIPADGIVLDTVTIEVPEGASAYEQLAAAVRAYEIQMESEGSSRSAYVRGINYTYEFDFGDLSGWMFEVNGKFANIGCGEYKLSEGDAVRWVYTCELGRDVGDNSRE